MLFIITALFTCSLSHLLKHTQKQTQNDTFQLLKQLQSSIDLILNTSKSQNPILASQSIRFLQSLSRNNGATNETNNATDQNMSTNDVNKSIQQMIPDGSNQIIIDPNNFPDKYDGNNTKFNETLEQEIQDYDLLQIQNSTSDDPQTYTLKDLKKRQQIKYMTTDDSNMRCIPECKNRGICEMGQCYCPYPYTGKKCDQIAKIGLRFSSFTVFIGSALSFFLGMFTIYIVKKISECLNLIFGTSDEDDVPKDFFRKE